MKKEKRNRGLSSWNEKVALGLRKEKQLAFKATTHIHKNTENEEKKKTEVSAVRAGHIGIKKWKDFC